MSMLLVLVFLVLPIAELAVIVQVAGWIGVLDTIGLLILVSLVGVWFAKRQGLGVLARMRSTAEQGQVPSKEMADGALLLLAGALMIAPGFLTDALAVVLLIPPTRALVRELMLRSFARRGRATLIARVGPFGSQSSSADVWDADSWEDPPSSTRRQLKGPR